jgi:D-glycero-alpha-D-manno-heptose 1-phosphate guanylyltransferase
LPAGGRKNFPVEILIIYRFLMPETILNSTEPASAPGNRATEAIILAGGLGTRLRSTIADLPKCMAPVAGRPFIFYAINQLRLQGIERFIISLGYKHEMVHTYLLEQFAILDFQVAIEDEPLGTGGAIRLAGKKAITENIVVANGDTIFRADIQSLYQSHLANAAECTLGLKPMRNFDRYGVVELDGNNKVTGFREKQEYEQGNINGGLYILNIAKFLSLPQPEKFSFETDYLETRQQGLYAFVHDEYFIDIGIPEDYDRAQQEFKRPPLQLSNIKKDWTLFLDRDGVINHEKQNGYILQPNEFIFYEGVPQALQKLSERFGKIIVVTNQRGIGKGMMTEADLDAIHEHMISGIAEAGGRIDKIYYCTAIDPWHPSRKPNPGMVVQALRDDPSINLSKSVIAGNNTSDMLFGRNAGMYTVFIRSTHPGPLSPHADIDLDYASLSDFAEALQFPVKF